MKKNDCVKGLSADNSERRPILLRIGVMLMFLLGTGTAVVAQENVTVSAQRKTISEVFQMIEKQTRYVFLFEGEVKPELQKEVTVQFKDKPIEYAMAELLKGTELSFKVSDRQVLVYKKPVRRVSGQPSQITGRVVSESGEPLIGATIAVKSADGGTLYTTTSSDGSFHLNRRGNEVSITASYVGYEKSTQKIRVGGG